RPSRGDRRSGSLALQPWLKLRDRSRTRCGWRVHRALSDEIIERYEARDCHRAPGMRGKRRAAARSEGVLSLKRFEKRTVLWKPLLILILLATIVLAVLYVSYRLVDPLPPRHLAIAAG